jgi:hypothetical protein
MVGALNSDSYLLPQPPSSSPPATGHFPRIQHRDICTLLICTQGLVLRANDLHYVPGVVRCQQV